MPNPQFSAPVTHEAVPMREPVLVPLLEAIGLSWHEFEVGERSRFTLSPRSWLKERLAKLGYIHISDLAPGKDAHWEAAIKKLGYVKADTTKMGEPTCSNPVHGPHCCRA